MKDVDFDILKCLVEYMYKGEANVPQQMLPSFIQTAESLQIRGLCDGASKQKLAELNTMGGAGAGAGHMMSPGQEHMRHGQHGQDTQGDMRQDNRYIV